VKIANIFLLDRPSRGGLSFIKRHTLFQSTSTDKSASVNRSHKLLDDGRVGSWAVWLKLSGNGLAAADRASLASEREMSGLRRLPPSASYRFLYFDGRLRARGRVAFLNNVPIVMRPPSQASRIIAPFRPQPQNLKNRDSGLRDSYCVKPATFCFKAP
jgi:hypothetical protein